MCGRHAKCKTTRLWADLNQEKIRRFTKVQALYRGWCVRKVLVWAGPGVLKRALCVNDDDLVTCEERERQDPMSYFGFEEAGKVWWFDFGTAWEWCTRSVAPLNPYTNVPIQHADLARLRKLHLYRRRKRLVVPPPPKDLTANIARRWTILAQVFRSFGFDEIHPQQFADLDRNNMNAMFRFLMDDIEAMPRPNRRLLALCSKGVLAAHTSNASYLINSLNLLTIALTDLQSYDIVFLLLSALYRC